MWKSKLSFFWSTEVYFLSRSHRYVVSCEWHSFPRLNHCKYSVDIWRVAANSRLWISDLPFGDFIYKKGSGLFSYTPTQCLGAYVRGNHAPKPNTEWSLFFLYMYRSSNKTTTSCLIGNCERAIHHDWTWGAIFVPSSSHPDILHFTQRHSVLGEFFAECPSGLLT